MRGPTRQGIRDHCPGVTHSPTPLAKLLELSPNAVAKRMRCTSAQATALQKYVLCVLVVLWRRQQRIPCDDIEEKASRLFQKLPKHVQAAIVAE